LSLLVNCGRRNVAWTNNARGLPFRATAKRKGSKLWNELPTDVKEIKSHSYFKFKIKDYLLHSLD